MKLREQDKLWPMNRLSRWGVGPKMLVLTLAYAIVAGIVSRVWPDFCRLRYVPRGVSLTLAVILLAVGFPMLGIAATSATKAYNSDRLVTTGIFALVRHPIYASWIVLILPGLALLSHSWPLLPTPLVAYAVFKLTIHQEDEYLERRFGQVFVTYRASVNELLPLPRFRKKG